MKEQKLKIKTSKGITLIALIITIIVLLILATVSIKLLVDQGIIGRAKGATNRYLVEQEKEKIKLGYSEYKTAKFEVEPNLEELDLLERYFLGKEIGSLVDDNLKFIGNEDTIPDAEESLKIIGFGEKSVFIIYNTNQYEVIFEDKYGGALNKSIQMVNKGAKVNVQDAEVIGNEIRGWRISFPSGNIYELSLNGEINKERERTEEEKLLEKYFFGEDGEVVSLYDVMNFQNMEFLGNDVIQNASKELEYIGMAQDNKDMVLYISFKYNDKLYKLKVNAGYLNLSLELIYEPKGRVGQTVKYSYDGTPENEKDWTILYDYGDNLEIISPEAMGSLMLGGQDEEAEGEYNSFERGIYSYNNAIKRLNEYAGSLITNSNKISVRNVGSNPENPESDNVGMYKSERLSKWCNGAHNGVGKESDTNYNDDFIRMQYCGICQEMNGQTYWLASRLVDDNSNYDNISFGVRFADRNEAGISSLGLCYVYKNLSYSANAGSYRPHAVRPVVKISSDSIKQ